MKTRMGRVQQALKSIFDASPKGRFTILQLARAVYGEEPTPGQIANMRRAMHTAAPRLGLTCCRIGSPKSGGWHHVWGKAV